MGIHKSVTAVYVSVVGTEERDVGSLSQFTVYVVQVAIEDINMKVFLRYSQIADLEHSLRKRFPQMSLPHFSLAKWNNHQTKVIEDRKFQIEKLLQIVLNA